MYISALTGYGMDDLLATLDNILGSGDRTVDVLIPYSGGDLLNRIHNGGRIISEEYEEAGIHVTAVCPARLAGYIDSCLGGSSTG